MRERGPMDFRDIIILLARVATIGLALLIFAAGWVMKGFWT